MSRKLLPSIMILSQKGIHFSSLRSLLRSVLLQDKLPMHSYFSLSLFSLISCNHSSLWSQIQTICLYHTTSSWVSIYLPESALHHSMPSPCASRLCDPLSPHSFGVTGLTPNFKFMALIILSCWENFPLPYESMLSLQVDQHTLMWFSSEFLPASQVW